MILFSYPEYGRLASSLRRRLSFDLGRWSAERFASGERFVTLGETVQNQSCFILGSVAPPDERLVTFLMLADTLKRQGASRVTAVVPYLAYTRSDKPEPRHSLSAAWLAQLLKASHISAVFSVDLHSRRIRDYARLQWSNVSPAPLFADFCRRHRWPDATIIAPDRGAVNRASELRRAAGIRRPILSFEKRRTAAGVTVRLRRGHLGKKVILVDDLLDTGGTLIANCRVLRRAGVRDITVMVTHALLTGTKWPQLWKLGVKEIVTTDTVPNAIHYRTRRFHVLRVALLIATALQKGRIK